MAEVLADFLPEDEAERMPDGSLGLSFLYSVFDEESETASKIPGRRISVIEREPAGAPTSLKSKYGDPLPADQLAKLLPPGGGGLIYHATLRKDAPPDGIKPRRPTLDVTADEFFSSIVCTDDKRWIFSGVLCGWPALQCLELMSITARVVGTFTGGKIKRLWTAGKDAGNPSANAFPKGVSAVRLTLRGPPWTAHGWKPDAPGFVLWWQSQHPQPRCLVGTDAITGADPSIQAVRAHIFTHRFAKPEGVKETMEERQVYHSNVLVEWSHGKHCSIIELGNLNMVGTSRGRQNWYAEVPAGEPAALYEHLPPGMVAPVIKSMAEIRWSDVPLNGLDPLKAFMAELVGPGKRFLDPHFHFSEEVRLMYRSERDVARYLLNYMGRDDQYDQLKRNCQYFASDFAGLLCGKKYVEPFLSFLKPMYTPKYHLFLYEPSMFGADAATRTGAQEEGEPATPGHG